MEAMNKYIQSSLAVGIIIACWSWILLCGPVLAAIFWLQWTDVTVKKRYPLPLLSSAIELLHYFHQPWPAQCLSPGTYTSRELSGRPVDALWPHQHPSSLIKLLAWAAILVWIYHKNLEYLRTAKRLNSHQTRNTKPDVLSQQFDYRIRPAVSSPTVLHFRAALDTHPNTLCYWTPSIWSNTVN